MTPEPVTFADRYVLEERIAGGGMAVVWKARDAVLARAVAVKVLHPHLSEDAEFLARFKREAMAAARLTHPGIVSIYDTGSEPSDDGSVAHYIVMELCLGETLADVIATDAPLPPERTVAIGCLICDALGYAHRNGVIHRDVKPGNVLITENGSIKVGDFGIAKASEAEDITATGDLLGTVTYLSPEQARGREPDARSDIYSLGVVLYELLVARPPFTGESHLAVAMQHINEPPPPLRSFRAGVPRALEAVILKALEKEPEARWGSAEEMRAALQAAVSPAASSAVLREVPAPDTHGPGGTPFAPIATRWIAPVVGLITVAALLALGITYVAGTQNNEGGGPGGNGNRGSGRLLTIAQAQDFDPYGDDKEEHRSEVPLAHDGNPATAWQTSTYSASFQTIGKPGVGLLFDLGAPKEVRRVQVISTTQALELRASDSLPDDEQSMRLVEVTRDGTNLELDDPETARYWLVWITELPGGGAGSASISEVKLFGS